MKTELNFDEEFKKWNDNKEKSLTARYKKPNWENKASLTDIPDEILKERRDFTGGEIHINNQLN